MKNHVKVQRYPALKPRMVYSYDGDGVAIVRVPEGTPFEIAKEAVKECWRLAWNNSNHDWIS